MAGLAPGNRQWELLGNKISRHCLAALMGVRPQRFKSCQSGHMDKRYRCFGAAIQLHDRAGSSSFHEAGLVLLESLHRSGWYAANKAPCFNQPESKNCCSRSIQLVVLLRFQRAARLRESMQKRPVSNVIVQYGCRGHEEDDGCFVGISAWQDTQR